MNMKKTLSFEKETLRTLVSAELDSVVGGWNSASSPMPGPHETVSSPMPKGGGGAVSSPMPGWLKPGAETPNGNIHPVHLQ
jgi:hypothetical protein